MCSGRAGLLFALALLFGLLGVSHASPAAAARITIWEGTLTVQRVAWGQDAALWGCSVGTSIQCRNTAYLTSDTFSWEGGSYRIDQLSIVGGGSNNSFTLVLDKTIPDIPGFAVQVDDSEFPVGSALLESSGTVTNAKATWDRSGLVWSQGQKVAVKLTYLRTIKPWVTLSASPNPVEEGNPVDVIATLSEAVPVDVTLPLTSVRHSAETGDFDNRNERTEVTIRAGSTSGTFTYDTVRDADAEDDIFEVKVDEFDPGKLPSAVQLASPSGVWITIEDTDAAQGQAYVPEVLLQAGPNPVAEGERVGVSVILARASASAVTVPLTVTRGTSEDGDHGTLASITVPAGRCCASGLIATALDGDGDDETFTVAVDADNVPSGYRASTRSSVEIAIADDGVSRGQGAVPTVSLSAAPNPVREGSDVRVTATLSAPAARGVTVPLTVTRGTSEDGDHGTLASLFVPAGGLSGTGTIRTYHDYGPHDETFTVALGTVPGDLRAGSPSSVEVTIADDDVQSSPQQQQDRGTLMGRCAAHLPGNAVTVAEVRGWRDAHAHVASHVLRWNRVIVALGEIDDPYATALTAAESRANERRYMPGRWSRVTGTLEGIEACLAADRRELAALPEVSIAAGAGVTEGESATFTLTASPAPASALTVGVRVTESGGYAGAGTRQVTVPAGGTASFSVATVDDAVDEPDGSVTATLAAGAGYTVSSSQSAATVAVADDDVAVPDIVTPVWSTAREEPGAAVAFTVRLSGAAAAAVSVDYATADGAVPWRGQPPAKAGADYTATSGTLSFAPGETEKTVRVAILDDSIDEGGEYFLLRFSNPDGATLASGHRESVGLIRNADPLQAMWLARFGRMVAADAVASVTARLETPRDAGSHVTVVGQRMNFGEAEGGPGSGSGAGKALATVLTGFAQTFGASSAPMADKDDPFARHGLINGWNDAATVTGTRRVTARELLLGTSFRAVLGQGAGSQWTSWGQGASVSRFSAAVPGLGLTGEAATGSMGMDYERGRLLMGFAMTHSVGEGTANDAGWRYALGSTATMMLPYARIALSDRISAWGLAGTGSGTLSLDLDGAVPQSYRTDLSMTLAATGVRGELVTPAEAGGFALALKADAFWVRTESDRVTVSAFGSLMGAQGESSRVRAVLDGSRTFSFASGAGLTPSLELGVRHDAGDAETGTGLEFGAGLGYADPSRGLDMALRVHGLAVHAEDGYEEWGVSGQLRLVPGGAGRGLSASLTPSYGVDPEGSERLWALPASSGLAANPGSGSGAGSGAAPSSRFDAEVGYGMALLGDRFTGTPNVGLGLSDTAREYRIGWRLTSAVAGDPGFEVSLDATRREAANNAGSGSGAGKAEHGAMLRSLMRW